ncbi:MAG TPA: biotin/lipoyl-binding protein, partial [Nevskiaceae bacterium]|nr:biotin/lipoyl-binding protein [Nevskiaceae bacterium]
PALAAAPVTLPARAVQYRPALRAWARVAPLAPLTLSTPIAARVAKVLVVPGEAVRAGQPLIRLAGPEFDGALSAARARWQAARRELAAAQRTAASAQRTYPVTTDRKALDAAEAALAAAESESAAARAALHTLHGQQTLSSQVPAIVEAVRTAPGAAVVAGEPLLTLSPSRSLWLRAEVFGARALPVAQEARFVPADGGLATAVRRVAELPTRAPDGARVFNFAASGPARWQAGETGELIWQGIPRHAVVVPAEALILDAARWYVLTDVKGKLAAQRVTPGPAHGTGVVIVNGLAAGTPVVVRDAYLLFHRHFSAQYEPAD